MDVYDPLDAFLESEEVQKSGDRTDVHSGAGSIRLPRKREYDEISEELPINERDNLLKGLNKPMAKNSFGLRMLEKMGYKEGEGLGKNGDGIKEPIPIKLKSNKQGIGIEESERRKAEEEKYEKDIELIRQQLLYNMKKQQYNLRIKEKENRKQVLKDIRQAQFAIEVLDEQNGRSINRLLLSEDDDCDTDVLSAHLKKMIEYLRSTYFYCIYCGCDYSDEQDLAVNCPGWNRDVH